MARFDPAALGSGLGRRTHRGRRSADAVAVATAGPGRGRLGIQKATQTILARLAFRPSSSRSGLGRLEMRFRILSIAFSRCPGCLYTCLLLLRCLRFFACVLCVFLV